MTSVWETTERAGRPIRRAQESHEYDDTQRQVGGWRGYLLSNRAIQNTKPVTHPPFKEGSRSGAFSRLRIGRRRRTR